MYMPVSRQGEGYKFSKPFDGPFEVLSLFGNGAELKNINKPRSKVIRVALNRMRQCPKELKSSKEGLETTEANTKGSAETSDEECQPASPWCGWLRSQCPAQRGRCGPT